MIPNRTVALRGGLAAAALAVAPLAAVAALAAQQDPLARSIPASSYAVIEFGGLRGCAQSWREHGLAPLVDRVLAGLPAARRRQLLGRWHRDALPGLRRELGRWGVRATTVRALLRGPCAVVIGRPTVASGLLVPSVALLFDVREDRQLVERGVERLAARLTARLAARSAGRPAGRPAGRHGQGAARRETIDNVATWVVPFDNPAVRDLLAGIETGRLVVSNSRGLYREVLATMRGRGRSLAQLPAYAAGREQLQGRQLGALWLDPGPIVAAVRPFLPYEAGQIADSLGLGTPTGLFCAAGTGGAMGREIVHIGLRGSAAGLFRAPVARSASLAAAAWCKPETLAFATCHVDPAAFFAGLQNIRGALPGWMRREIERGGRRELRILESVGAELPVWTGEFTVACAASEILPIPEVTLFAGTRDGGRASDLLRGWMERIAPATLRTQTFLGTAIHSIQLRVENIGIAPCFASKDGMILISTHPQILKATLRRWQKKADNLGDAEEFARAARQARDCFTFGYVAVGAAVEQVVGSSVLALARAELGRLGFDPDSVPESDEIRAALGSAAVAGRVDETGCTWTSTSAFGNGSVLALVGYLVDRALRDLIGRDI